MLKLLIPDISHKGQWEEIIAEWGDDWRKNPRIFFQDSYEKFLEIVRQVQKEDDVENKIPKSSCYFLYDEKERKVLGFYTFRHNLNYYDDAVNGGHIGYGIRPSARKNGYGKEGLKLVLDEVRGLGFSEVYISCDDENIGSWKIIEANGGVLEKFCFRHGVKTRRYQIHFSLQEKELLKNLEIELLGYEARHNPKRIDELLADDFFECGKTGKMFGKKECLEGLPNEKTKKLEAQNVSVHMLADGVAQVRYIIKIAGDGEQPTQSFRTSLWRKTEKGWQMFFHQGTLII